MMSRCGDVVVYDVMAMVVWSQKDGHAAIWRCCDVAVCGVGDDGVVIS